MRLAASMPRVPLAVLAFAAVGLAACGGSDSPGAAATDAVASAQRMGERLDLPRPLAENLEQANEIVGDGPEALQDELAALEGFPVVVNQWGSWCSPCRVEFPLFAESAEAHLGEVAFIGIDIQDDRGAAEEFLAEFPTPYPHIFDQDNAAVVSLQWSGFSPTTWLIDESGEIVHQRPGAYANREQLEADIERFLLRG
jgi:cytochrome c biogenesis protein CcmG/thiol:disulfide interchange protein DsbE